MEMEGSTARLLSRQRDGAYHGWRFKLGRVMTRISGTISTRLNDGFSMRGRVCRSRG